MKAVVGGLLRRLSRVNQADINSLNESAVKDMCQLVGSLNRTGDIEAQEVRSKLISQLLEASASNPFVANQVARRSKLFYRHLTDEEQRTTLGNLVRFSTPSDTNDEDRLFTLAGSLSSTEVSTLAPALRQCFQLLSDVTFTEHNLGRSKITFQHIFRAVTSLPKDAYRAFPMEALAKSFNAFLSCAADVSQLEATPNRSTSLSFLHQLVIQAIILLPSTELHPLTLQRFEATYHTKLVADVFRNREKDLIKFADRSLTHCHIHHGLSNWAVLLELLRPMLSVADNMGHLRPECFEAGGIARALVAFRNPHLRNSQATNNQYEPLTHLLLRVLLDDASSEEQTISCEAYLQELIALVCDYGTPTQVGRVVTMLDRCVEPIGKRTSADRWRATLYHLWDARKSDRAVVAQQLLMKSASCLCSGLSKQATDKSTAAWQPSEIILVAEIIAKFCSAEYLEAFVRQEILRLDVVQGLMVATQGSPDFAMCLMRMCGCFPKESDERQQVLQLITKLTSKVASSKDVGRFSSAQSSLIALKELCDSSHFEPSMLAMFLEPLSKPTKSQKLSRLHQKLNDATSIQRKIAKHFRTKQARVCSELLCSLIEGSIKSAYTDTNADLHNVNPPMLTTSLLRFGLSIIARPPPRANLGRLHDHIVGLLKKLTPLLLSRVSTPYERLDRAMVSYQLTRLIMVTQDKSKRPDKYREGSGAIDIGKSTKYTVQYLDVVIPLCTRPTTTTAGVTPSTASSDDQSAILLRGQVLNTEALIDYFIVDTALAGLLEHQRSIRLLSSTNVLRHKPVMRLITSTMFDNYLDVLGFACTSTSPASEDETGSDDPRDFVIAAAERALFKHAPDSAIMAFEMSCHCGMSPEQRERLLDVVMSLQRRTDHANRLRRISDVISKGEVLFA